MLLRFLYRNLRGYRRLVVLAIVVTILQVGCDIGAAMPLKFIPSKVSNPGNDPSCMFGWLNPILDKFDIPLFDSTLQNPVKGGPPLQPPLTQCPVSPTNPTAVVTSHHSVNGVIVFCVLLLVAFGLLAAVLAFLDLYLATYIAQNLSARLRNGLFDHLQRLSLDWHGKQKKGDLVQRVTGNIADVQKLVTDGLVDLLAGMLTLAGVLSVMWLISGPYTLISIAVVPVLFIAVLGFTKSIKVAARRAAKATGHVADVATEDINALTVIKVFTREERESLRFGSFVDTTRRAGLRAGALQAQFTPIVSLLLVVGTATILGVGGYVAEGFPFHVGFFTVPAYSVDIGTLILFLTFLKLLYQPMRDLSKLATLWSTASSGIERIEEVLSQEPEVLESARPYYGPTKLNGDIAFENVVFGYVPDRPVLHGITLHIPAGRKIALVGLSGGGKTTLVKLIPRFYEIQQGSVRIDGLDNRLYPLRVLRQNVSMVLQDSVLFEGTIRDNIAVGRPGAADEEIVEAARRAHIHETIVQDLGGYDRLVREQGKDLSGGQRQRLAIARAILRDAPILILDEPTAALDVEAEAEVMRALNMLIQGRTVLMISHRLSTLGDVDEIVVLKDGRIAERGTFGDLKRKGGVLAALLAEQNRYNIEKLNEGTIIRSAFASMPAWEAVAARQAVAAPSAAPRRPIPDAAAAPVAAGVAVRTRDGVHRAPAPNALGADTAPIQTARVTVEADGKVVAERGLDKPILTVGRHSGSDVRVPSHCVSRLHARIIREDDGWVIEDADSLNGLIYQGHRVDRLALADGDEVYLGPLAVLRYATTPAAGH